jgi:hypothetical protein
MNKEIRRRVAVGALALAASFSAGVTSVALTQHEQAPVVRVATDNRDSVESPAARANAHRSSVPVLSHFSSGESCAAGAAVPESRTSIVLVSYALHPYTKNVTGRVPAICYLV